MQQSSLVEAIDRALLCPSWSVVGAASGEERSGG